MVSWIQKFDIDGYRVDYAHGMPLDYFSGLRLALEAVKPIFLLAEAGSSNFHPAFDMTYDWDVYPLFGEIASGRRTIATVSKPLLRKCARTRPPT